MNNQAGIHIIHTRKDGVRPVLPKLVKFLLLCILFFLLLYVPFFVICVLCVCVCVCVRARAMLLARGVKSIVVKYI
jgi:hypothetical protein